MGTRLGESGCSFVASVATNKSNGLSHPMLTKRANIRFGCTEAQMGCPSDPSPLPSHLLRRSRPARSLPADPLSVRQGCTVSHTLISGTCDTRLSSNMAEGRSRGADEFHFSETKHRCWFASVTFSQRRRAPGTDDGTCPFPIERTLSLVPSGRLLLLAPLPPSPRESNFKVASRRRLAPVPDSHFPQSSAPSGGVPLLAFLVPKRNMW